MPTNIRDVFSLPGLSSNTIDDCRAIFVLYEDATRASADVKRIANEHLEQIDSRIASLEAIRDTRPHLIAECVGDHRTDCPILKDLYGFKNKEQLTEYV